jgi:hypothetical protein
MQRSLVSFEVWIQEGNKLLASAPDPRREFSGQLELPTAPCRGCDAAQAIELC